MINNKIQTEPTETGFFGNYGGQFIPDDLKQEFDRIYQKFLVLKNDKYFNDRMNSLLKHYCGKKPLFIMQKIYLKSMVVKYILKEDLNHTGAHKINHCLGEVLLAKSMGKTKVIAETGAGQHGVAMATAAALLGLECDIYMGEKDVIKEKPNVERMKILGANIIAVKSGERTLKEAVDEAFIAYSKEYTTALYAIGSAVGPHPFPSIIEYFQSVVGREAREQFMEITGTLPDGVIACVGGGSNSIGIFNGFIDDAEVKLYGVEPLGKGAALGENAASITYGKDGIIHGFKCLLLQNDDGSIANAYSVASGLDYPGVGPKHCYLKQIGRAEYKTVDDKEAINAFYELSRMEGIIPALESSHAVAYAIKFAKENPNKKIIVNLSGRGDKDIEFVLKNYPIE